MPDARLHVVRAVSRAARRVCVRIARAVLPATLALLAGCADLPARQTAEDDTSAAALAHEAAQQRLHTAVQAAQPGQERLATARRALESLLADDRAQARALHPYARALLEQLRVRQQVAALAEHLRRQLDERTRASDAQALELDALRRQNAALQRQLDALAEIERELTLPGLPVRPRTGLPE